VTSIVASAAAAILTHAQAAGAAIDPPITDVARSDLLIPGSGQRCIRVAWDGEETPSRMGAGMTLNSQLVGERFRIRAIWTISEGGTVLAANRDADVAALRDELRTRLLGDATLGGACTDLALGYVATDWFEFTGSLGRVMDLFLVTDYSEFSIAP
jgi:hypothetical protein